MQNDNTMIENKNITSIGASIGLIKGLIVSEAIADLSVKIITTLILGIVGAIGAHIGKKIYIYFEKLHKSK